MTSPTSQHLSPTAHLHADATALLTGWAPIDPGQRALRESYLGFLAARPDACDRACAPGHLTASAVVFDRSLSHVALVHHRIVGAWLQPGGHLEASDASLLDAAAREVREELGLEVEFLPEPVGLDCHGITCRGYTQPTRHFDVRFAGIARGVVDRVQGVTSSLRGPADSELLSLQLSEESHGVRWWALDALPDDLFDELRQLIDSGVAALSRSHQR